MLRRFMPWKSIARRAAKVYGVSDPVHWLQRLRGFSQPSEVAEPIELLRAGIHFHARGLVNTKAIQHNLDWVWPYWVERQFDPRDASFIPRAFSFSHINLTHRNWTAVGWPELSAYPIVDPRGLVTPLYDGWSLDFWLFDANGKQLLPSRTPDSQVRQSLTTRGNLMVQTQVSCDQMRLTLKTSVELYGEIPSVVTSVSTVCPGGGALAVAVRPYNPEGVQFIDRVESLDDAKGWLVNGKTRVFTDRSADRMLTCHYDQGDVLHAIPDLVPEGRRGRGEKVKEACDQGMATAVSVFPFTTDEFDLSVSVPLAETRTDPANSRVRSGGRKRFSKDAPSASVSTAPSAASGVSSSLSGKSEASGQSFGDAAWNLATSELCQLAIPDARLQRLYQAAVRTLILLSVDEIVPGPYTYRRFWFRDACLMMNPMMSVGMFQRCRRMLNEFPSRQLKNGYFRSQDGEWDSNGQVLWVLNRFRRLSGEPLPEHLVATLEPAVRWIDAKRVQDEPGARHAGLLPAGFSAEHLGPNDFYYWDDLWAEAGLRSAAQIWEDRGDVRQSRWALRLAEELKSAIEKSLAELPRSKIQNGFPASPYRRLDSGAIGSMVADYPLQLTAPGDTRINATIDSLIADHFCHGGFFQDMVHSGINAYLTLAIAQTLLRNGDRRFQTLIQSVADLASPTGQWPEAIHPATLGGCMGDGQHGWAAAEWVMMLRNCFVREEPDRLVVGAGLFDDWLSTDVELLFGPTWTPWGQVTVRIETPASNPILTVTTNWHSSPVRIDARIAGVAPVENLQPNVPHRLERKTAQASGSKTVSAIPPKGHRT